MASASFFPFYFASPAPRCGFHPRAAAQETPYFVAYSHHLEEPGNLEIETYSIYGTQKGGGDFIAPWMELEYGVTAWWTTEFYIDSQHTFGDSTVFTGTRWENRFRPLMREHWINPVLYVEFENTTDADKTLKEVVGFDSQFDAAEPNSEANRVARARNRNQADPFERLQGLEHLRKFHRREKSGPRAVGIRLRPGREPAAAPGSHAAARAISAARILFWARKCMAGLGTVKAFTLSGTSHYVAPIVAWQLPNGVTFSLSPGFGLNDNSHRFLLRWGMSYEIDGFGRKLRSLFR